MATMSCSAHGQYPDLPDEPSSLLLLGARRPLVTWHPGEAHCGAMGLWRSVPGRRLPQLGRLGRMEWQISR